ncbi:helix-turn-helix domain-containing protein [Actinopolymorpha pittospori]
MSEPLRQETYLPDDDNGSAEVYDFLRAHENTHGSRPAPRYLLAGSDPGDSVELPEEVYRILRQVVDAMRQGHAVTVSPQTRALTTQQAADLLGVSRPTVVKLLDDGKIPFERTRTHRRILLKDLLEYRERRRAEQYAALEATSVSFDEEEDLDTVLEDLRAARRAASVRRRQTS